MFTRSRCLALLSRGTLVTALLACAPFDAAAVDSYRGSGDTGWRENNQRDCCADAVALAQQDSARRCEVTGHAPKITEDTNRGMCDWEARGDGVDLVYRCTATADVLCR